MINPVTNTITFRPINVARWLIWGSFALVLLVLPLLSLLSLQNNKRER